MSTEVQPAIAWPARYELLDGLRGLAALMVVLNHVTLWFDAHYAVMVFFVISGYCITASAESCLRSGAGFREFMLRRVRRIYPPYLLAVLFYVVTRAVKVSLGGANDLQRPLLDWVQNLTLTQWVSDLFHPVNVPSNNSHLFVSAFWSLNYEEQFYLVIAVGMLFAMHRRLPLIALVALLTVVGLIWNWSIPGNWICGLFIEYWPHFAMGSFLYFVLCRYVDRRSRLTFLAVTLLIGAACLGRLFPWNANAVNDLRAMIELGFLSAVLLGLYFLRPLSARINSLAIWRPVAALGTISYSLYLIHQFNLIFVASIANRLLPTGSPDFIVTASKIALHVGLAAVFWYLCERPFLRKRVLPEPVAATLGKGPTLA